MLRPFNILFVLLFLARPCLSQFPTYYFKNYKVENGLSSNTITAIIQDKKGFMWFGSRNGLNRFDGNVFKVFSNKLSDSTSIGSNSILSLYEDAKQHLWVGTYNGIYLYNPVKEDFTCFKLIPEGEVRYIQGDKQHNIWIVSNLTLYKYNQRSAQVTSYPLLKDQTISLHISEAGSVWTATSKGLIKQYNPRSNTFSDYNISKLYTGKNLTPINALYSIGDTSLIIGTVNKTLLFNKKSLIIRNILSVNKQFNDVHIHTIFRQSPSEFWIGTEAGLYIFNIESESTTVVAKELSNPYSITDNIISAIFKDTEGGTWIGSYFGGINYHSKQFNNFHKYFTGTGKNKLKGNLVHEICKDQNNQLWIGTEDAGLNQMDLKTGQVKNFLPDKKTGSISYHNIHGLVADGNELWIGTYEHGLDVMDLRTNKVIRHYEAAENSRSFTSNFIVTLYKTRNGDILVGTWNGLFKYNRKTDNFSPLPYFDAHIQTIHEDKNGTLWVGTYGSGVYYHNAKTNKKGRIEYKTGNPRGLINNYVNNLYEDSRKNFWFCTEGGLSHYVPSTGQITNFTVEAGLSDNQVFRILEDDKGMLWISTAKGLSQFDQDKRQFINYHTTHGLPTEQFNYNSAFKDPNGTLFFGTVKGLISFKPTEFIKNRYTPPVYITGLQINNGDVNISVSNSSLKKAIIYTESITLPYDQSNLSLDVAALSYIVPEQNGYMYKMEGLDKSWITLKNNRKIFYTKLPPGDYTFRIKGSNSQGIWNNQETALHIKITPPLWATIWAYIFYFLIVLSVILIIFWYYRLALNEKNKRKIDVLEINKEREIYTAKIEFFTNVAHEIRTPLTLIKWPLDKLITKGSNDAETTDSLIMIKKNTSRLIDLTNQLLDFRKAEANNFSLSFAKTDINEVLNDVYLSFKSAAEQKNLSYKLELPRITLHAWVDAEAFKKIITNLINNAIKYTEHNVLVKLLPFSSDDLEFHIEFKNDGYIITEEHKFKIFEPFYRIRETSKEAGTGIGLSLARSLSELHKGTLDIKKSDKEINMFLLSLPIHQDYELNLKDNEPADLENLPVYPDEPLEEMNGCKPTVLIVEDNKEILGYLQHELAVTYHVIKAFNGQEALDVLRKKNVQLVISDIMMPVMDGIELCKTMKNDFQYSHIPILLLTAKNSTSSRIEGLEVGADAYIEKPFSFDHLLAQMTNLLSNRNIIKEYFARSPLSHIKGIAYSKADKDFLEKLNRIIYERITDTDLDVDQLSGLMNMSRPTLYRKIKGLSDLTPNELINLSRLKKAAEFLAEGSYKINEVANRVGYSMPTNFSRDFQKQFGMSPSNYLNNLKNDDGSI
ncbi:response regulator [Flavihumibacter sp. R14]|nr:response regulator [Flavihumibacter soli]